MTSIKPKRASVCSVERESSIIGDSGGYPLGVPSFCLTGELEVSQEPGGLCVCLELGCTLPVLGFWFKWPGTASRK